MLNRLISSKHGKRTVDSYAEVNIIDDGINLTADGCNLIKCKLILLQNSKTQSPSGFVMQTIYVGKGDNRYSVTGKWKLMKGTAADPDAIVYQLLPDSTPTGSEILLVKAGSDLLFFVNRDSQLLVGNDYCSYTLNRTN